MVVVARDAKRAVAAYYIIDEYAAYTYTLYIHLVNLSDRTSSLSLPQCR